MRDNIMQNKYNYWWKEQDPHSMVVGAVKWLDTNQAYQYELNLRNLLLYSNRSAWGLRSGDYVSKLSLPSSRLTVNAIQSVIDAAVSQISTVKPRIMNLTNKGDWAQQNRAKKLNEWTQGILYETDAYALGRNVFRDACIFGTGALKILEKNGRAALERVFIDDLMVDERDSIYGTPRQIFEVREVNRDLLIEMFPDSEMQIKTASNSIRIHNTISYGVSDMVSVVEAYHLPSGPDADDGMRVICTDNGTLLKEEWTKNYFPYAFMRWGIAPLGFWGWGIAEQITGIQCEINYILQKIQRLMTIATSQLWIRKGSGIDKNKLNNEDWAVREYVTEPPTFFSVQSVSPEYFAHVRYLIDKSYEVTGVNQLTAQARKPAGLNSGRALDTYQDYQSQRFMEVSQRYEEFFVQIADKLADLTSDIAEREGSYTVKARTRRGLELLDWREVKVDREEYVSQPYPTSFFPQTPSGKWNQIQEMMQAGFLSPEEAGELLDYPDLNAITSLKNAPIEYVRKIIEDITERGEQRVPDPYSPLELITRLFPLEILKGEQEGMPEERLDMLRNYMSQTQRLMGILEPQPPQQPTPMPQDMPLPQTPPMMDDQMSMQGAGPV